MGRLGKISMVRDGDAAAFACEKCGATENVANYENGQKPKRFEWNIWMKSEHAKCLACNESHDSNLGQQYG